MQHAMIIGPDGVMRALDRVCAELGAGHTHDQHALCRFLVKNFACTAVLTQKTEWRMVYIPQRLSRAAHATCLELARAARAPRIVLETFAKGWQTETRAFSPDVVRDVPYNTAFYGLDPVVNATSHGVTTVTRLRRRIVMDQGDCLPELG